MAIIAVDAPITSSPMTAPCSLSNDITLEHMFLCDFVFIPLRMETGTLQRELSEQLLQ